MLLWILPASLQFRIRVFHALWMVFPVPFCYQRSCLMQSEPHGARTMVWALPRSLAATCGIVITFSSSGYLDVSVHRVPSVWLWIYHTVTGCASRVPPFRYLRIPACLRLPVAFRSLSRLSSALSAKASTLRPFLLNLRSAALSCGLVLKMSFRSWRFISVGLKFYMLSHVHDFSCALLLSQ